MKLQVGFAWRFFEEKLYLKGLHWNYIYLYILISVPSGYRKCQMVLLFGICGGPEKGLLVVDEAEVMQLNLRIRTGCVPASWGRRQRPWRSRSSSWRVRCRWRHPWWRSQGTPSTPHGSPRRWGRRYASHLRDAPNVWWRAWWCPGCCLSTPYGASWRLPFPVPCLLCRVQSWFRSQFKLMKAQDAAEHLYTSLLQPHWSAPPPPQSLSHYTHTTMHVRTIYITHTHTTHQQAFTGFKKKTKSLRRINIRNRKQIFYVCVCAWARQSPLPCLWFGGLLCVCVCVCVCAYSFPGL